MVWLHGGLDSGDYLVVFDREDGTRQTTRLQGGTLLDTTGIPLPKGEKLSECFLLLEIDSLLSQSLSIISFPYADRFFSLYSLHCNSM